MKKLWRREWMVWATPFVALTPLVMRPMLEAWPQEWRVGYRGREKDRKLCRLNLRPLWVAFQMYARDYNEKLPPASIGGLGIGDRLVSIRGGKVSVPAAPVGWTGALLVYTQYQPYQFCHAQSPQNSQASWPSLSRSPTSAGFVDYWLNARLAGRATRTLSAPASTFLLGEGNDGRDASNATYSKSALPQAWISDKSSPLFRHLGGANFLFADGHVAWLKPPQAQHFGGRADPFAP